MTTVRDRIHRVLGGAHLRLLRMTGGRLGSRIGRGPILVLITEGRRSGRTRTSPLIYAEDRGDFIIAASNAGQDHAPGWYYNLRSQPDAVVEVKGRRIPVRAVEVPADETGILWPKLDAVYRGYSQYRQRTRRRIPLLRLRPHPTQCQATNKFTSLE